MWLVSFLHHPIPAIMKHAYITGANKGIGLEIARQLGHKGYHVFIGSRSETRGQLALRQLENDGVEASLSIIDVSDPDSIRKAFEALPSSCGQLDVLINNAGILHDRNRNIFDMPESLFAETIQTNALGALHTVRVFKPLLKQGSRVINISSGGGAISEGVSTWAPAYCISKTTMNAITLQLASALAGQEIPVNAVCPGWVRTDMGGNSASRSVSEGADTPVWLATEASAQLTGKFFRDRTEIPW